MAHGQATGRIVVQTMIVTMVTLQSFGVTVAADDGRLVAETELNVDGRLPVVSAEFLGQTRNFVFDTGTSIICVDRVFREPLGVPVSKEIVETAGGKSTAEYFQPQVIRIGGGEFTSRVGIPERNFEYGLIGISVSGFIGINCFLDHVVELNPDPGMLRIYRELPADRELGVVCHWIDDRHPVKHRTPFPHLAILIPPDIATPVLVDSGMSSAVCLRETIFRKLYDNHQITDCYSDLYTTVAGQVYRQCGTLKISKVSGQYLRRCNVTEDAGDPPASSVGWGFLRRFITTIDFPNRDIYLTPSKNFDVKDVRDMSGLQCYRDNDVLKIARCQKESPAYKSGIRSQQTVISIDGQLADDLTMQEIFDILSREGETVEVVVVNKQGQTVTHSLELREFRETKSAPKNN